ncbi:MAG: hypothetical protein QOJ76_2786, partial [Acidobacteriota bacterium]|nr:hypothetical protein [Acidobacteriota bacterium]
MPGRANKTLSVPAAALLLLSLLVGGGRVTASAATCSVPNFRPAPVYDTGLGPGSVATADFNNDGRPDL